MTAVKVWTGSAWAVKPLKVWSGSAWAVKPVKFWDGTGWSTGTPPGVTLVGSNAAVVIGSPTSGTAPAVAGVATGDVVFCAMFWTDNSTLTTVALTATGWTAVNPLADSSTAAQRGFYQTTWGASSVWPSFTMTPGKRYAVATWAVRNGVTPVTGVTDAATSSTTQTAPSVTATAAGLLFRCYVRKDTTSVSVTPPGGYTQLQLIFGAASPGPHLALYYQTLGAAGATGTAATVWPVTSQNSTSWTVAL